MSGAVGVRVEGGEVSDPIVYIDASKIRYGKLEELRAKTKELAAFVASALRAPRVAERR